MNTRLDINAAVVRLLEDRVDGVTPQVLAGLLAAAFGRSRRWGKAVIGDLVAQGELAYREQHGHTIIEPSFDRPVRFSPHVVVRPPGTAYRPGPGEVVARLAHGVSFGTGQHPTTRLSVRGIDLALTELRLQGGMADTAVLDIGTGSGILAIVSILLGIDRGIGVDIDPCALSEARQNALLNGLSQRLSIGALPIEEIQGTFTLITANLRFPTLRQMFPEMLRLSAPRAGWVISGIRSEEIRPLMTLYADRGVACQWKAVEKDWAALVFARRDGAPMPAAEASPNQGQ